MIAAQPQMTEMDPEMLVVVEPNAASRDQVTGLIGWRSLACRLGATREPLPLWTGKRAESAGGPRDDRRDRPGRDCRAEQIGQGGEVRANGQVLGARQMGHDRPDPTPGPDCVRVCTPAGSPSAAPAIVTVPQPHRRCCSRCSVTCKGDRRQVSHLPGLGRHVVPPPRPARPAGDARSAAATKAPTFCSPPDVAAGSCSAGSGLTGPATPRPARSTPRSRAAQRAAPTIQP